MKMPADIRTFSWKVKCLRNLFNVLKPHSFMGRTHGMTENEKKLLDTIGRSPDLPVKEIVACTNYKWASTIVKKMQQFRDQHIVRGPLYSVRYSTLCKNPLHLAACFIETEKSLETVISYLRAVETLTWTFPILSYKRALLVGLLSSNDAEVNALLQLLKDNDIITHFAYHVCRSRRILENPHFFGDMNPSLDNLLSPCAVPDTTPGVYTTEWSECDVAVLPYLLRHSNVKLIEILKEEKKKGRTWTYSQINYSREKMIENGLIRKEFVIYPFPYDQCVHFFLILKTGDTALTHRILHNFARGGRVLKIYVFYDDYGVINCFSHPQFLADLMHKLDSVDEITEKELYERRSIFEDYMIDKPPEMKYFDVETQRLEYPYHVYGERIKEKLENKE